MSEITLGATPDLPVLLKATSQVERILQEYAWVQEHLEGARIIRRRWEPTGSSLEMLTVHLGEEDYRHVFFRIESGLPEQPIQGLSMEAPIPIGSVAEEYQWVRRVFQGLKAMEQELRVTPIGPRDVLTVNLPEGEKARIWFDITAFFGRSK